MRVWCAFAVSALAGCGSGESRIAETQAAVEAPAEAPPIRRFTLDLEDGTGLDNIVPQILRAAHPHLVPMCQAWPDATVRVMNPYNEELYEEVPCASVLGCDGATGEAGGALRVGSLGEEPVGAVAQPWSLFGLGCSVIMLGLGLFTTEVICGHPRAEYPKACKWVATGGFGGLGIACAFF